MTRRLLLLLPPLLVLALLAPTLPGPGAAEAPPTAPGESVSGFEGRILLDGDPLPGARIFAYRTFPDFLARVPHAVSLPADGDGTYTLPLPPGSWFLVAKNLAGGSGDGPLATGDSFSYQGANPIRLAPGQMLHLGFAMTRKTGEVVRRASNNPSSGSIEGVVRRGGKPLEGATVFLYLDPDSGFRGEVYAASPPTGPAGRFRFDNLPQSPFFVIARQRPGRSGAGPLADGDLFGFFPENPVDVTTGGVAAIELEVISKVGGVVDQGRVFADTGTRVRGRILGPGGAVVEGVYAFAYLEKVMAHRRPAAISRTVDKDGGYVLHLPGGGRYYLGARSSFGEGPTMGEWYGRYDATPDHSLEVADGATREGIDIQVERILP